MLLYFYLCGAIWDTV